MRVLVVGGFGALGREVGAAASADGHEVVASVRPDPDDRRRLPAEVVLRLLDLRDPAATRRVVEADRPDAVINAAYVAGGPDLDAVTAVAPGVLAAACAARGIRFVHVSTDVVFDGRIPPGESYGEAAVPNPVHVYGRAKLEAEVAVAARDPAAAVVRTSLLYPGTQVGLVERAVSGAEPVTFFDDEWRSPCRTADLARFLLWLAVDPAGRTVEGVVHAAGADAMSRAELALRIAAATPRLLGAVPPTGPAPAGGPPRPRNCVLRSDRGLPGLPLPGLRTALDGP